MEEATVYGVPFVNVSIEEDNAEVGCIELLKHIRPAWTTPHIHTKIFTAGFMNRLVYCRLTTDDQETDVVLVRVFGEGTKLIIDREKELLSIRILHAEGLAAPVLCRFRSGIAYGFSKGKCLLEEDMLNPSVHRMICRELAKFHRINPNKIIPSLDGCEGAVYDMHPYLFDRTLKFLDIIPDVFKDNEKGKRFEKLTGGKAALKREVEELQSELNKLGCKAVLSHNDLLQNNIVLNPERTRVSFIDLEEVYVNYLPFDIAAHVMEYAGIRGGYDPDLIPGDEFIKNWLKVYLEETYILDGKDPNAVSDRDVEILFIQVMKFTLTHSIFAGIWCLIQVNYSLKDVDFMSAAEILLNQYYKRKDQMLALKLPGQDTE